VDRGGVAPVPEQARNRAPETTSRFLKRNHKVARPDAINAEGCFRYGSRTCETPEHGAAPGSTSIFSRARHGGPPLAVPLRPFSSRQPRNTRAGAAFVISAGRYPT